MTQTLGTALVPLSINLQFIAPWRLWWLMIVPAVALLYLVLARRIVPSRRPPSRIDLVIPRDRWWKRHLAVIATCLAIIALVIAYAKPKDHTDVPRDRATIVIAIDVSLSMEAEDVKPSRMKAEQEAAIEFLGMLPPRFNVAVVAFAGNAAIVVPPTIDRGAARAAIENLQMAPMTAIGEGIYTSLNALTLVPPDPKHPNSTPPAAIVLLSDGGTNVGRGSYQAAKLAKSKNVPIYTIAYGTPRGYVVDDHGVKQPVPVDHTEMQKIADASGGKKFKAESSGELKDVYKQIAQSVGYTKVYVEVTDRYVGWGLLFAALAALCTMSLAARWP